MGVNNKGTVSTEPQRSGLDFDQFLKERAALDQKTQRLEDCADMFCAWYEYGAFDNAEERTSLRRKKQLQTESQINFQNEYGPVAGGLRKGILALMQVSSKVPKIFKEDNSYTDRHGFTSDIPQEEPNGERNFFYMRRAYDPEKLDKKQKVHLDRLLDKFPEYAETITKLLKILQVVHDSYEGLEGLRFVTPLQVKDFDRARLEAGYLLEDLLILRLVKFRTDEYLKKPEVYPDYEKTKLKKEFDMMMQELDLQKYPYNLAEILEKILSGQYKAELKELKVS